LLCIDPEERISLESALNHKWFDVVTKKQRDAAGLIANGEEVTCESFVSSPFPVVGQAKKEESRAS
jgi:hypothetical protein